MARKWKVTVWVPCETPTNLAVFWQILHIEYQDHTTGCSHTGSGTADNGIIRQSGSGPIFVNMKQECYPLEHSTQWQMTIISVSWTNWLKNKRKGKFILGYNKLIQIKVRKNVVLRFYQVIKIIRTVITVPTHLAFINQFIFFFNFIFTFHRSKWGYINTLRIVI